MDEGEYVRSFVEGTANFPLCASVYVKVTLILSESRG